MAEWNKGPILTLDLASSTGWAIARPGEKLRFGSVKLGLSGATPGEKFRGLRAWFMDMTALDTPYAVCFEAPLNIGVMSRIGANADTVYLAFGLCAIIEEASLERGVTLIRQVNVQDVRKHFVGQRTFKGGRSESKRAVMSRCKQLGHDVKGDDAADAVAIWDYACSIWAPKIAAQRTVDAMVGGVA
jgi:hypothetical protein